MNKKVFKIAGLVILGLFLIIFCYFFIGKSRPVENIELGVTFSKIEAERYGLDWQKTYLAALDELNFKKIRLIAYWPEIESGQDQFNFADLDWQIEQAKQRGGEIILAVGQRLPRWPECHIPDWAQDLSKQERNQQILEYISRVVNRYKNNPAIKFWQVENEPFLSSFGECPKLDKKFLEQEIELVRELDSEREIILTESGEFSTWIGAARRTNIIGSSLYRIVWAKHFNRYIQYPIPAIFYQRKISLIKTLFDVDEIFVIELQAEPWGPKQNWKISLEEQKKSMDLEKLKKIVNYTKKAGFSKAYLWGVEWWYWMKTVHNQDQIWEEVKRMLN